MERLKKVITEARSENLFVGDKVKEKAGQFGNKGTGVVLKADNRSEVWQVVFNGKTFEYHSGELELVTRHPFYSAFDELEQEVANIQGNMQSFTYPESLKVLEKAQEKIKAACKQFLSEV
jgi:hypothetical protein